MTRANSAPDDTEIADRIVEQGIGKRVDHLGNYSLWPTFDYKDGYFTATEFINDWRVIGALLEKATDVHIDRVHGIKQVFVWNKDDVPIDRADQPLTRKIAVAFFAAQDEDIEITRPMKCLTPLDPTDITSRRRVSVADVLALADEEPGSLPSLEDLYDLDDSARTRNGEQ